MEVYAELGVEPAGALMTALPDEPGVNRPVLNDPSSAVAEWVSSSSILVHVTVEPLLTVAGLGLYGFAPLCDSASRGMRMAVVTADGSGGDNTSGTSSFRSSWSSSSSPPPGPELLDASAAGVNEIGKRTAARSSISITP